MKIDVISDVHLEFGDLVVKNHNNAKVLVMAGDICVVQDFLQTNPANVNREFFNHVCNEYQNVIYVVGNHEHYNGHLDKSIDVLRQEFRRMNLPINLLDCESVVIEGITFAGTTLWTDFNDVDPVSMFDCQRRLNDYRYIRLSNEDNRILHPQDTVKLFTKSVRFIDEIAGQTDQSVVVVGHHAPSNKSVKPMYEHNLSINGAYRSNLEWIMEKHSNIKLWIHGHTHSNFDYKINQTRVVCNPRGYVNYERGSQDNDPYFPLTVEI